MGKRKKSFQDKTVDMEELAAKIAKHDFDARTKDETDIDNFLPFGHVGNVYTVVLDTMEQDEPYGPIYTLEHVYKIDVKKGVVVDYKTQ